MGRALPPVRGRDAGNSRGRSPGRRLRRGPAPVGPVAASHAVLLLARCGSAGAGRHSSGGRAALRRPCAAPLGAARRADHFRPDALLGRARGGLRAAPLRAGADRRPVRGPRDDGHDAARPRRGHRRARLRCESPGDRRADLRGWGALGVARYPAHGPRRDRMAKARRPAAAGRPGARVRVRGLLAGPGARLLPAGVDVGMSDKSLARTLGFATAAIMALTQAPVGFVRDEGYYFTAAQSYESWLRLLLQSPLQAIAQTEGYWSYNFEHPGLTKLLFAASHLVFTTWLGVLPDALAWRLPAFAFAGLLSYWLCLLGLSRSRAAGVLSPLLFWCAERTFFHGHLACFDIPICAMWAGVGLAWLRGTGPRLAGTYGLALAVKHNAWFLPPVLLVHALLLPREQRSAALRKLPWLLLSPLVLFAAWPLLWHDPLRHLGDWIAFHAHHVHYAWWYFGQVLRAPPFPVSYPLVLDALVLPLPIAAMLAAAGVSLLVGFARRRLDAQRLLELGLAGAALLPFLLRTTPIFGGIKHWLAFLALLAPEAASLATLLPGLWQIVHLHPYGTSAYGELAGGTPGAATLGMQRQYWSNNVTGVLPWLNSHCPLGARVYFHEVNVESYHAYILAGLLRPDIHYASDPEQSDYAALQWHREFRDREPQTWNAFGTRRPATGLYLDEVPQVVVYARPGLPGAP